MNINLLLTLWTELLLPFIFFLLLLHISSSSCPGWNRGHPPPSVDIPPASALDSRGFLSHDGISAVKSRQHISRLECEGGIWTIPCWQCSRAPFPRLANPGNCVKVNYGDPPYLGEWPVKFLIPISRLYLCLWLLKFRRIGGLYWEFHKEVKSIALYPWYAPKCGVSDPSVDGECYWATGCKLLAHVSHAEKLFLTPHVCMIEDSRLQHSELVSKTHGGVGGSTHIV